MYLCCTHYNRYHTPREATIVATKGIVVIFSAYGTLPVLGDKRQFYDGCLDKTFIRVSQPLVPL